MKRFFKNFFKYSKRVYFKKALDFWSRASRKEYLYAITLFIPFLFPLLLFSLALGIASAPMDGITAFLLPALATLPALGILSATIRRLNDCNTPKIISFILTTVTIVPFALLLVVTYVMLVVTHLGVNVNIVSFVNRFVFMPLVVPLAIIVVLTFPILIYYLTKPSTPRENKYGPQPED